MADRRRRPRPGCAIRSSEVSSHYLVHEDGSVVQMVRESDRAWHAGKRLVARPHRHQFLLGRHRDRQSGHAYGYPDFPTRQIDAVIALVPRHRRASFDRARAGACAFRHGARPQDRSGREVSVGAAVCGRCRPLRRAGADPAAAAVLTAGERGEPVEALQSMLALYGYGVEITGMFDRPTEAVVAAFQRHFRPRAGRRRRRPLDDRDAAQAAGRPATCHQRKINSQ